MSSVVPWSSRRSSNLMLAACLGSPEKLMDLGIWQMARMLRRGMRLYGGGIQCQGIKVSWHMCQAKKITNKVLFVEDSRGVKNQISSVGRIHAACPKEIQIRCVG